MIVSTPPCSIPAAGPHTIVLEVLFGNFAEAQSKDFNKEAIDEGESAEDYGYSSDSDLEDDDDMRAPLVVVSPEQRRIPCEERGTY